MFDSEKEGFFFFFFLVNLRTQYKSNLCNSKLSELIYEDQPLINLVTIYYKYYVYKEQNLIGDATPLLFALPLIFFYSSAIHSNRPGLHFYTMHAWVEEEFI